MTEDEIANLFAAALRNRRQPDLGEICKRLEADGWERVESKDIGPEGAARVVMYRKDGRGIVVDMHAAPLTAVR